MERTQNKVYMTQKELGEVFGFGRDFVHRRVDEISKLSGNRYKYPFCGRNIHAGVFVDWCANRKMLMNKNTAKFVKPFNPYDALDYTFSWHSNTEQSTIDFIKRAEEKKRNEEQIRVSQRVREL